mmetsp:Transcript_11372/g.22226  ORF Transcript_11372/g.22226 Transcript_11372/m.22226 type:complete len:231 (+) Transcript_11372:196-888(+)
MSLVEQAMQKAKNRKKPSLKSVRGATSDENKPPQKLSLTDQAMLRAKQSVVSSPPASKTEPRKSRTPSTAGKKRTEVRARSKSRSRVVPAAPVFEETVQEDPEEVEEYDFEENAKIDNQGSIDVAEVETADGEDDEIISPEKVEEASDEEVHEESDDADTDVEELVTKSSELTEVVKPSGKAFSVAEGVIILFIVLTIILFVMGDPRPFMHEALADVKQTYQQIAAPSSK